MIRPWFGDLLRPFAIVCGQLSLQVIYFFVIHKQSQSFRSLLPSSLLSLLILRLWAFWSTQQVQPGCSIVFFLSRVSGNLCPLFPGFSFPTQGRVAAMGYSSRLCPCPVGLLLPPCSLLVVRSGGNFRLVVSGEVFLAFTASVLLAMRWGSPLSFFTVRFHILGVCRHLHNCVFSLDLRGLRFTHPALRWPGISPVSGDPPPLPSPRFC